MKFTFDTNYKNNKYEIKLSIGEGLSAASTIITIGYNDTHIHIDQQIEHTIKAVLDNTRFTVKEREIAEVEATRFIGYLQNNITLINPHIQLVDLKDNVIDIFEDDTNNQQIDDEELLNEQ